MDSVALRAVGSCDAFLRHEGLSLGFACFAC